MASLTLAFIDVDRNRLTDPPPGSSGPASIRQMRARFVIAYVALFAAWMFFRWNAYFLC